MVLDAVFGVWSKFIVVFYFWMIFDCVVLQFLKGPNAPGPSFSHKINAHVLWSIVNKLIRAAEV